MFTFKKIDSQQSTVFNSSWLETWRIYNNKKWHSCDIHIICIAFLFIPRSLSIGFDKEITVTFVCKYMPKVDQNAIKWNICVSFYVFIQKIERYDVNSCHPMILYKSMGDFALSNSFFLSSFFYVNCDFILDWATTTTNFYVTVDIHTMDGFYNCC